MSKIPQHLTELINAIDAWRALHEAVEAAMLAQDRQTRVELIARELSAGANVRRIYAELVETGAVSIHDNPLISSRIVARHIAPFNAFTMADPVDWGLRQAEQDRAKRVEWEMTPKAERDQNEALFKKPYLIPRELRSEWFFHNKRRTAGKLSRAT